MKKTITILSAMVICASSCYAGYHDFHNQTASAIITGFCFCLILISTDTL